MFPLKRLYCAGAVVALAGTFTLFCALVAAGTHSQSVCSVPGDHATIQAAVDDVACETVNLGAGTFYESVTISRTVTLQGQGEDLTFEEGNEGEPVFNIRESGVVTLTGITVRNVQNEYAGVIFNSGRLTLRSAAVNSNFNLFGGGIYNDGTLILLNSKVADNSSGQGGGILNAGVLTVTNSAISGNIASSGGAILNDGGTLYVTDSTLSGNRANGGGIANFGTAIVIRSTISDNWGCEGGGILNSGTFTVTGSTLSGNSVVQEYGGSDCNGGGIYNSSTLTVKDSTLSGNAAQFSDYGGDGGGIYNDGGTAGLENSTLSGNSALRDGGGIYNVSQGKANLNCITLSGNTANARGGGIFNAENSPVDTANSIIAESSNGADCSGSITSLGHNIDSDGSCGLTAPGDLPQTAPLLGPLQDNGGPTLTHALLKGSPAIDSGDDTACPATDQRGVPRPLDGDMDSLARCDIGAFELAGEFSVFLPLIAR